MSFELLEELLFDRGWWVRRYRTHLATLLRSTFVRNPAQASRPATR
jgi:hypothetical protein